MFAGVTEEMNYTYDARIPAKKIAHSELMSIKHAELMSISRSEVEPTSLGILDLTYTYNGEGRMLTVRYPTTHRFNGYWFDDSEFRLHEVVWHREDEGGSLTRMRAHFCTS